MLCSTYPSVSLSDSCHGLSVRQFICQYVILHACYLAEICCAISIILNTLQTGKQLKQQAVRQISLRYLWMAIYKLFYRHIINVYVCQFVSGPCRYVSVCLCWSMRVYFHPCEHPPPYASLCVCVHVHVSVHPHAYAYVFVCSYTNDLYPSVSHTLLSITPASHYSCRTQACHVIKGKVINDQQAKSHISQVATYLFIIFHL